MKYSMLHRVNGRVNGTSYQTDWDNVNAAIDYYEKEKDINWAVIVECETGNIVHLFNSTNV